MITCTRRLQFCAGHRVWKHENKCAFLHGHNYVAFFEASAPAMDALDRVIDFGELKVRLGTWIEEEWDHGFILHRDDAEAIRAVRAVPGQKLYLLDGNPTAETMADHLLRVVAPRVLEGTGVRVVQVTLWETENSYATATLGTATPGTATPGTATPGGKADGNDEP